MQVGILGGTGPLGRGLATRLGAAGHSVLIGSREPVRGEEIAAELVEAWPTLGDSVRGAGNEEAAASDVVVLATPWEAAVPTVRGLAGILTGKVVICVANALVRQGREMHALVPPRGSVSAGVQAELPGSAVAAACQHLPASELADLHVALDADVLVCADREEARVAAAALLADVAGLRPIDAGSLHSAAAVEAFTAVLITINMRYKAHTTLRLAGLDGHL